MSFYSILKNTANSLLVKFGQSVTISRNSAGSYNTSTGTSVITTTTQNSRGALFDYGLGEIDGTLILKGDKKMLLSAVGITKPFVNDVVSANGSVFTILSVNETNPANSVVMYELQLRGV